jgi:hypothetical protein
MAKFKKIVNRIATAGAVVAVATGYQYFARFNQYDVDANVIRSRQPSEAFVRRLDEDEGLAAILSLRDETGIGPYKNYAEEHGIALYPVGISKKAFPPKERLQEIVDVVSNPENFPLLMHCQAGIDRSGFAAAVYELVQGKSAAEAKKQLSLWHGHISYCPLDKIIDSYEVAEGKGVDFETWVSESYNPEKLAKEMDE